MHLPYIKQLLLATISQCYWLLPELARRNQQLLEEFLLELKPTPHLLFSVVLFLSCNCPEVDDSCLQAAGNDETTDCRQLLLKLADGQAPHFFFHANEAVRQLDTNKVFQATYTDEAHKKRDIASMVDTIRQKFNTVRDKLEGKFFEIGIEGFLEGVRTASNKLPSRTISKVRLGIVKAYSRLVEGLRTLYSSQVECFFMVDARCGTFDEYRSEWVRIESDNPDVAILSIECWVDFGDSWLLESEVNLMRFAKEFEQDIGMRQFARRQGLELRLSLLVSDWLSRGVANFETVNLDFKSFDRTTGKEAAVLWKDRDDILGVGSFLLRVQTRLVALNLPERNYFDVNNFKENQEEGDNEVVWESPPP